MAYIRAKGKGWQGQPYYYLVEAVRDGGKVRQRVLFYLGRYATVQAALAGLPADIDKERYLLAKAQANMAAVRERLRLSLSDTVPYPRRAGAQWANRLYGKYWYWEGRATQCEIRMARLSEKLALLQSYCSAHNCLAD